MSCKCLKIALFAVVLFFNSEIAFPRQNEPTASDYHKIADSAIKIHLPDVQQPEDYSCGAAATMAILSYYGVGPEDYGILKKKLGTTKKNGTDFQRIVKYANTLTAKHGLKAEAHPKMTQKQLDDYLDEGKPVVCSIQAYEDPEIPPAKRRAIYKDKNDNGHYVVAIGYDRNNYYFMDPSLTGRRGYLPRDEFEERWHDNEGTQDDEKIIPRLGIVIWKDNAPSRYANFARKID